MDIRLDDKVAIVTGASKGIGRATAHRLHEAGATVVLTGRKAAELDAAAAGLGPGAHAQVGHAGDPDDIERTVEWCYAELGAVDVLVANAATSPYFGPIVGVDAGRWEKTWSVNVHGPVRWLQALAARGFTERGGAIVQIASIGGLVVERNIGVYNATKAALLHLTKTLAFELAPAVRINAVAPGLVKTDMARALWEPREAELATAFPMGRLGEPDDIAAAVTFLASDAAAWITGQTLVVDGGTTCMPSG